MERSLPRRAAANWRLEPIGRSRDAETMTQRHFHLRFQIVTAALLLTAAGSARGQGAASHEFDLLTAGIADIQAAVGAGALTYQHLVQLYLIRIEAYNRKGPELRAVIEINPRALAIA